MNKAKNTIVLQNALKLWGQPDQIGMFHEEIGELMKAINKHRRNPTEANRLKVQDETADVKIMLRQIELIFGSAAEYEAAKMERLDGRVRKAMRNYLVEGSLNIRFASLSGCGGPMVRGKFEVLGVPLFLAPQQKNERVHRLTLDYLDRCFEANKVKLDSMRPYSYTNDTGFSTTRIEDRETFLEYIVNTLCVHGIDTEFICYVDRNYIGLAPQVMTQAETKSFNQMMSEDKSKD